MATTIDNYISSIHSSIVKGCFLAMVAVSGKEKKKEGEEAMGVSMKAHGGNGFWTD